MISILLRAETLCEILPRCQSLLCIASKTTSRASTRNGEVAYSAAKVLLCIRRSSTSCALRTRKALYPEGII